MVSSIRAIRGSLRTATAAAVIAACLFLPAATGHCLDGPVHIRVLVMSMRNSAALQIAGQFEARDKKAGALLYSGKNMKAALLARKGAIILGEMNLKSGSVLIKPVESGVVILDGREFRGDIHVVSGKEGGAFSVINYVELEEYAKGVLYHEVSHHWPVEALKAQAVASRTFALYQRKVSANRDYDVTADIYSQVYGGKTSERYRTNQAVEETRGAVILYKNEILPAYYSATCAGHTEDASRLWDVNIEPLKGVECGFCADSPHFKWHKAIELQEIREALNKAGLRISGQIEDISVSGRNDSGRVASLMVSFGDQSIEVGGKNFRNAVGPNIIRSTDFRVRVSKNYAYFEGRGWGHAAGLCQWGAYFMAKRGYKFEDILGHYYPGSRIGSIDEVKP